MHFILSYESRTLKKLDLIWDSQVADSAHVRLISNDVMYISRPFVKPILIGNYIFKLIIHQFLL